VKFVPPSGGFFLPKGTSALGTMPEGIGFERLVGLLLVTLAGFLGPRTSTVYANSIRVLSMDAEVETEWSCDFTREEMLEQQARLLAEECHMLQKELSRYRKNMAKLIGMHADVALERDQLRARLRKIEVQLSDCLRDKSALGNSVAGLESCRDQLEAMHKARRDLASRGTPVLRGDS
jgi:regulator of replication initiation timing